MLHQSTFIEIELEAGEALSLLRAEACELHCLSGTLWLTEENGDGDIVLKRGDRYRLTRRGRTVIEAVGRQQGACCRLRLPPSPQRFADALRMWRPFRPLALRQN